MPKLTAAQARDLADSYFNLAQEVGKYRLDNWTRLSEGARGTLESRMWTLLNYSSDFTGEAVSLTVDELAPVLEEIQGATTKLTKAIKKLGTVQKVLTIAAAGIKLGASIMTGNADQIASAAQDAINVAKG
jgi:hypothetical protein